MSHVRGRSRSRSPFRGSQAPSRHRSRSPRRRHDTSVKRALPFGAAEITKHDLVIFRPMFALYLDIQKQLDIEQLSDTEVKGRWKSFIGRWNRGELAEGWYDPNTLEKAKASARSSTQQKGSDSGRDEDEDEDEDDDFGPLLPSTQGADSRGPSGATMYGALVPSLQELRARDEQAREHADLSRSQAAAELRSERRQDRKLQKERLDDITPRAEAGTRERQLEKKREKAESNRAFAATRDGGDTELRDADVMGDEDSFSDLRRMKQENERRKTEREQRKEDVLRARQAEREVRLAGLKEKEDRTMAMLKEIAKQRFGGEGDTAQ